MQRMKDEGAFRAMQAARMHSAYVWDESERRRQRILELETELAEIKSRR